MNFLKIALMSFFVCASQATLAQEIKIHRNDIPDNSDTTLEVKKRSGPILDNQTLYTITEGTANIEGDPDPLLQEARKNWTTACKEWKKEIEKTNKDNQVISHDCGTKDCVTTAMETTCTSKGTYKIRVRVAN